MLQRLNLTLPEREKSVAVLDTCASGPDAAEEIDLRAKLILDAGQVPDLLYVCGDKNKYVALEHPQAKTPVLLLFTTPYAARDYLRAMNKQANVGHVPFDALPEFGQGFINSGIQAFALNRCFRCGVTAPLRMQVLLEREAFQTWARDRAARWYRGERKFSEFIEYQKRGDARARRTLEYIRDHIDCGTPYLYELIAFSASLEGDEAAKSEALERLQEFGPQFADWESKWGGPGMPPETAKALAAALVGLAQHFGIAFQRPGSS